MIVSFIVMVGLGATVAALMISNTFQILLFLMGILFFIQ